MTPLGVVQTLGGRRRGGTRELAVTADGSGASSTTTGGASCIPPASGGTSCWKHFTRHVPISGHAFSGQFGQGAGFAGLWQGISAALVCAASGYDVSGANSETLVPSGSCRMA